MKKFLKLSLDTRPQEQPEGTYRYGKNGVQNYVQGSIINEKGFRLSSAQIPFIPMGILETDKYPIIFSTNNTDSAIGFFDPENDVYVPIADDRLLPFKFNFKTEHYITGQVQRNYKNELVGAFTDKSQLPFYMNFDNPVLTAREDVLLFPVATLPTIETEVQTGGTLFPGAYYAAVQLAKKDGTETGFLAISAPKIINGINGLVTDQSLLIKVGKIDPAYELVQVAIISKINGVTKAVRFQEAIPMSVEGTVLYSGAELTEDITLEEILIPFKSYLRVGTMGQLNDALYITDLVSQPKLNMQKYANLIRLHWHSKLITVDPVYEPMKIGAEKTFMHQEVYDFYIRYSRTNGEKTDGFAIPGLALTAGDLLDSATAAAEGLPAGTKVFQVSDTIPSFDPVTKAGLMGKWQNSTEVYPDTPDFDSSNIGGENLRGQPVRHHRFPSLAWCKQNLYQSELNYGKSTLDMLGISVENVVIPPDLIGDIIGWEIFYAKRTLANSTVLGQSALLFSGVTKAQAQSQGPLEDFWSSNGTAAKWYSSGGNWDSEARFDTFDRKRIVNDQSSFRLHSFDMLLNRPSVSPTFLSPQLKLRVREFAAKDALIEDGDKAQGSHSDGPIVFKIDFIQYGEVPTAVSSRIKGIELDDTSKLPRYTPNNTNTGRWYNLGIESSYTGVLTHPEKFIPDSELDLLQAGTKLARPKLITQETTFLTNLMSVKQDLYSPFTGQSLVRAGQTEDIHTQNIFWGGDSYICDYSFHTYGMLFSNQESTTGELNKGTRVVRRIICECASNLYNRFQNPANVYTQYYPKTPLIPADLTGYLSNFNRAIDPNPFSDSYNKDSNALDDLISVNIFNTYAESLTEHTHRIHRGGKISRQTKFRNWRTWLPLDYYEMQKNMGRPIRLEGMDDRLLIHCENALFLTQDKAKLESDIISVTLGSGDIFQFEPQEGLSDKLGYAGTQHELACVRTPIGYIFIDSKEGNIYIYKGGIQLMNNMLNTFFKEFLRLKENNVFIGNGYTIGYDPEYKRLLLTVKNKQITAGGEPIEWDPENLPPVGTIVNKNGKILEYLGVNTTEYECPAIVLPVAGNLLLTVPENTPIGTVIGTVGGSDVDNYLFTTPGYPFSINSATGDITLVGPLDFFQQDTYSIDGVVGNVNGTDGFNVTIQVTFVNQPPQVIGVEVTVADTIADGTLIGQIIATDRENDGLSYNIVSGNMNNAWLVNIANGEVTKNAGAVLDATSMDTYNLTVDVFDGTTHVLTNVIVHLVHINQPPASINYEITILDTTPDGEVVLTTAPAQDPENDEIIYALVSQTVPGAFEFDLTTLQLKVLDNSLLDPYTHPIHTVIVSASDQINAPVNSTITVNILWDQASLAFIPDGAHCSPGGTACPVGWTLSDDGLTCTKITTTTAVLNGAMVDVCPATNGAYSDFGAVIYNPGYSLNGTGSVNRFINAAPWNNPLFNETDGVLNRCGVWGCTFVPDNEPIGFVVKVTLPAAKTYYVGMAGDNKCRLVVDGVTIIDQDPTSLNDNMPFNQGQAAAFKWWHIYPITLSAGVHFIGMEGVNYGAAAGFGAEIYNNTPDEIEDAILATGFITTPGDYGDGDNMYANLDLIYSTRWARGGEFQSGTTSGWSCADPAYALDFSGPGDPTCNLVESQPAVVALTRIWDYVKVRDTRTNTDVGLFNNINTPRFFQGIPVPYYPPFANHIDCGGTDTPKLNVVRSGSAQKNDCVAGLGSIVVYSVPAGSYMGTSQAVVDGAAEDEVNANKQAFANLTGKCNLV